MPDQEHRCELRSAGGRRGQRFWTHCSCGQGGPLRPSAGQAHAWRDTHLEEVAGSAG